MRTATRQSIPEADPARQPRQVPLPTGPTHIAARSRTPEQVESNRAFMAAAGRVEFGRYENTRRAVWIAFAYFASLGLERICYATVEHIAERAKVSGRTVQRHILALAHRDLLYAETRVGGHTPTVWKVLIREEAPGGPGVTRCHPRGDSVSPDIRNRSSYRAAPLKGQARPCVNGVIRGSNPVTTAAPMKGSPAPSLSPLTVLATPDQIQPHIEAMRQIAQTTTSPTEPAQLSSFNLDTDLEARFVEQDRLLHEREAQIHRPPPTPTATGCPECGHDRIIGGSCDQCGYDDGTGFQPSADYNNGH